MGLKVHYRIHVTGMVQGVGFRWSIAIEAWKRGITGYVKNIPDGSVVIEAEGAREPLEEFAAWCRHGPGTWLVDNARVTEGPLAGYREFRIER
ncbi:MAG: acylphosphatase [Bacteroidales bacterium]|jgi:acylphosphatase|nr:acylphosphatase [Bacteroidales bacterium]HHU99397.1 acylphosphatase [Bacteroidales bacterium]HMT66275.1 acylphosphatase [Bacteroidales bacterium]HNY57563.1 acylphosphatase [Bacteroidales bacterium]HOC05151.1 acylphosphatase [Bacteroidales bacterium]